MDWQKVFSNIKYEFKKSSEQYHNAESETEQKAAISSFIKAINYLQNVLQGDVPDFYRTPLKNLLQTSHIELEAMEKGVGLFAKKAIVEGGGKVKPNGKEEDSRAQGLLDTIIQEKPNVKWKISQDSMRQRKPYTKPLSCQ